MISNCLLNCLFNNILRALYEMEIGIVFRKLMLDQKPDILNWSGIR